MTEQNLSPIDALDQATDAYRDSLATPTPAPVEPFDVEAAIAEIPNSFWLTSRRRLDLTSDEIVNDGVALSIVLAVRRSIAETGVADWERWLAASQPETNTYLGVDLVDDSKSS